MKLDDNYRYEIKAEAFRSMTRHMAPGKDASPASYPAPFEERLAAWEKWNAEHQQVIAAMFRAVESILPDDEP